MNSESRQQPTRFRTVVAPKKKPGMQYLIVIGVPCYPLTATSFAVESAFAEHLRQLAKKLWPIFDGVHLAAPLMARTTFERDKYHLGRIRAKDGISLTPLYEYEISGLDFWARSALPVGRTLWRLTRASHLVHTAVSIDLAHPIGFGAILAAKLHRRRSIFFVDIDFRNAARMNYVTGAWSYKSYWLCRYVYDPLRLAQIRFAAKHCSLVLLKSPRMVRAFGKGQAHVKDFVDTVHSAEHVLAPDDIAAREVRLRVRERPLHLAYLGRLVGYKGVDRTLEALKLARTKSGRDFRLDVIGAGPDHERLERMSRELGLCDSVVFRPAIPYGPELFAALQAHDLMIAHRSVRIHRAASSMVSAPVYRRLPSTCRITVISNRAAPWSPRLGWTPMRSPTLFASSMGTASEW